MPTTKTASPKEEIQEVTPEANGDTAAPKKKTPAPKKKAPKKSPPRKKKSGSISKQAKGRKVKFDKYATRLCVGDKAIDEKTAKEILGWEVEEEGGTEFKNLYFLKNLSGDKVRCHNNVTNRPLYKSNVDSLIKDILQGNWRFNGEPVIVGRTGLVLNGQHTLVALILANEMYEKDKADKTGLYKAVWKKPPTIDKLVVLGVDERDDVVNTMDTCKPRSLSDAIFRSVFFQDLSKGDRKKVSSSTDHAVRTLWQRTGMSLAFPGRRTHAESLSFIENHPTLLEFVKHIYEENGDEDRIKRYLTLGRASALLYLMAASDTDRDKGYATAKIPSESDITFGNREKAEEFWVLLAAQDKSLDSLRECLGGAMQGDEFVTPAEIEAFLVKAFNLFLEGKKITEKGLKLEYETDSETGIAFLSETPTVGGIDIGGA